MRSQNLMYTDKMNLLGTRAVHKDSKDGNLNSSLQPIIISFGTILIAAIFIIFLIEKKMNRQVLNIFDPKFAKRDQDEVCDDIERASGNGHCDDIENTSENRDFSDKNLKAEHDEKDSTQSYARSANDFGCIASNKGIEIETNTNGRSCKVMPAQTYYSTDEKTDLESKLQHKDTHMCIGHSNPISNRSMDNISNEFGHVANEKGIEIEGNIYGDNKGEVEIKLSTANSNARTEKNDCKLKSDQNGVNETYPGAQTIEYFQKFSVIQSVMDGNFLDSKNMCIGNSPPSDYDMESLKRGILEDFANKEEKLMTYSKFCEGPRSCDVQKRIQFSKSSFSVTSSHFQQELTTNNDVIIPSKRNIKYPKEGPWKLDESRDCESTFTGWETYETSRDDTKEMSFESNSTYLFPTKKINCQSVADMSEITQFQFETEYSEYSEDNTIRSNNFRMYNRNASRKKSETSVISDWDHCTIPHGRKKNKINEGSVLTPCPEESVSSTSHESTTMILTQGSSKKKVSSRLSSPFTESRPLSPSFGLQKRRKFHLRLSEVPRNGDNSDVAGCWTSSSESEDADMSTKASTRASTNILNTYPNGMLRSRINYSQDITHVTLS
mmetsp:Transcript_38098/g.88656  ORF Transcript_38098/g.88656 Transcript_38098/m.88656 type:complete len:609 (-) Transcript_38098:137-1963(-)